MSAWRRLLSQGKVTLSVGALGLGSSSWHYRVVHAKFKGLKLDKHWHAASEHVAYMVQTFIYNDALGRLQGYLPLRSYLLGRGWEKGTNESGSTSCTDRLASVPQNHEIQGRLLETIASEAVDWVRKVRTEGSGWDPLLGPNANVLRPNLSNDRTLPGEPPLPESPTNWRMSPSPGRPTCQDASKPAQPVCPAGLALASTLRSQV